MGKKKKYKVYKKGGESFKPHMMYNTKTGESYLANTYDEHARMDAMGYGHEPMMRMGGMPCYECGGGVHYEFGGSSTAPQNINTGDIGRTNIDLMKNHLAENTIKNILQQRDELVGQMTEQMYQYGGDPRLQYNPNRAFGTMAAQNYYGAQNKAMESGKNFWNSIQDFAQNYQTPRPYQPPMEKVKSKKADLSGAYAPTDPQLAIPQGGFKGAADYMAYGGDLPMAQNGTNLRANVPLPKAYNPYRVQPGYERLNEQEKRWIDVERQKLANPNSEWYNPKFTGFRDAATNKNDMEWRKRGIISNLLAPEIAISDPRRHRAIQNIIPGYGGGAEQDIISSIGDAFFMPQKMLNEAFTGYYEFPSETYDRYVKPENQSTLSKILLDLLSDPMIVAGPTRSAKAVASIPKGVVKGAKEIAETAEHLGKYGKKAALYTAEKAEEAYKATEEVIKKYGPDVVKFFKNIPYKDIVKLYDEYGSRLGQVIAKRYAEDNSPYSQEAMQGQPSYQSLIQPQQAAASSTAVAPKGPIPTVNPNQNQFSNLSDQELEAIIKRGYKYGGDLPKAQYGVYNNRNAVAAQNELEKRKIEEGFYNLGNPFYLPEPSVPNYTQNYDRYNMVTGEGYNVDEERTDTVTGSSAIAGAEAGAEAKETGKSKTTPRTAADVAIQQAIKAGEKAKEEADQVRKGNTDEASEGPAGTDTKTDNTKTGTVRTVGDGYGYYGQPMGRFKLKGSIKEYDPLTGKMTKKTRIQPLKYDTAYGPQNVFGRRGPRVVKSPINQTYNINPFRMDLTPGSESFNTLYNTSRSSDAVGKGLTPEQIAERGPEMEYVNLNQPGTFRKGSQGITQDEINDAATYYKGMQDDGVGPSRKEWQEVKKRDRVKDRETRGMFRLLDKANRDFPLTDEDLNQMQNQPFKYGGMPEYQMAGSTFDLNNYQPGQFTEGFGPQEGGFGPMEKGFNLWETGESPYMSTFKETDLERKWTQQGLNQGLGMVGTGLAFVGDAFKASQAENPDWGYTASATAPRIMSNDADRGSWTANAGFLRPDQQTPVQFGKYGGDMKYQDGGEYELTDQEIQAIISAGGEVEFL